MIDRVAAAKVGVTITIEWDITCASYSEPILYTFLLHTEENEEKD